MKKIGILTFHNVINYGGVLQCYALQEFLKKLGAEVQVIKYNSIHINILNSDDEKEVEHLKNKASILGQYLGMLEHDAKTKGYKDVSDCSLYTNEESEGVCGSFLVMNNVSKIYLTTYSTTTFKNFVKDNNTFERDFREYISYLPTYSKNTSKTPNTGYYRVIVEYISNDTHKYGTMEVSR